MYKPTREDYLLFAQYSDQIDRSVRAEVDACVSVFPSRQPFHAARVMDESEYRQQLARAREAEAHRLNRIVEAPEPAPVIEIRNPAKFVQAVLVYLALGTALVAWMLHVRGCL